MKRTGVLVVFEKNLLRFTCIKIKFGRYGLTNTLTDIDVYQLNTLKSIAQALAVDLLKRNTLGGIRHFFNP